MKKLKFLVGAVALFALVVVNVWNAATTLNGHELVVADVEAMANPEGQGGSGSSTIGGIWEPGAQEDKRYFSMSGTQLDPSCAYSGDSYIVTYYQVWECASRSDIFDCRPPQTIRYETRYTYWSWNGGYAEREGNLPTQHKWDNYVLPY